MGVFSRRERADDVPAVVTGAVRSADTGRLLTAAPDADSLAWLAATTYDIALVDTALVDTALVDPASARTGESKAMDALSWARPWHKVEAATWGRESGLLTVTWVDRAAYGRPVQWRLGDGARERAFLQTVRERVQASVVLAEELQLPGRRTGRAVIRQDLRSGALLEQVVLGRGARMEDPEVSQVVNHTLAWLREQVGVS